MPPVCWVQVIDTDSHGADPAGVGCHTPGLRSRSTIYHLHNFGKSPKLLMPQFPNLDNKDKSVFPMN